MQILRCEFNSKNLQKFWCSLLQAYHRLVKRATCAFIPLSATYHCKSGFSALLILISKQKIEIGWMPKRPCMLLCQRHDHNFMFFLKTSSKSNSIEKAFASKLSVLTLYLCASVLPMQIAWEITACFQGCSGMGMRGNGVLAPFCTSNVTWRSGI